VRKPGEYVREAKYSGLLKEESKSFNRQVEERIKHGFIPDLRSLRKVSWLYNNVWREPEYIEIHWMPKVNFVLDIARRRGGKVIELGCGCGYLSLELARNGLDVTGIDISGKSIKIAEKYRKLNRFTRGFGSLSYRCCDFTAMDLGREQFDTVIFFRSLHHVKDISSLLRKVKRALKKDGNLVICEPARGDFTRSSAEAAAILRAILPTWIPYKEKLKDLHSEKSWDRYVENIYKEYTYKEGFTQSPLDNNIDSSDSLIKQVSRHFELKTTLFQDAFIDKLIGGIRGKDRHTLARFAKFLDQLMVKRRILPATEVSIHAKKK